MGVYHMCCCVCGVINIMYCSGTGENVITALQADGSKKKKKSKGNTGEKRKENDKWSVGHGGERVISET